LEKGIYQSSDDYGWYTSSGTRHFLVNVMNMALIDCYNSIKSDGQCLIPDRAWIKEAGTFILQGNKYEAAPSFYDDRLFALALADIGTGRYSEKVIFMPTDSLKINDDTNFYMKNGQPVLNINGIIARKQKTKRAKEIFY